MKRVEDSPRRTFLKGALATPIAVAGAAALPAPAHGHGTAKGLSTEAEPYLRPSIVGAKTVAILTVGDAVNGYRMVGVPDGLGAFKSGPNEFTLLMNHEIGANPAGIVRGHGSNGSFVSRWTIDARSLKVLKGQDHTTSAADVHTWDTQTGRYKTGTTQWQRHCSGDLPAPGAFHFRGRGTAERIYLNGEEISEGRAWARVATGTFAGEVWQLPRLGRLAFENAVACPFPQDRTIVVCTDDSSAATGPLPNLGSEVYVYLGTKQSSGHPIERAGLTNGALFGLTITVDGTPVEEESDQYGIGNATTGYVGKGRFGLHPLGDVSAMSGMDLEAASNRGGVARLQRCEDGAWDPRERHQNNFYFVTTASVTTNCRLWRLRFDDIERPEDGGTIEILLRGDEGHRMLDNVTIDRLGRIVMDEDPGGNNRIAKIWLYSIETREFIQVAAHNPRLFDPDSKQPEFVTNDEESSGIIDVAHILGDGWFLLDVQAHKASTDPELVEGGQLLALWIDPGVGIAGGDKHSRHDRNEDRR